MYNISKHDVPFINVLRARGTMTSRESERVREQGSHTESVLFTSQHNNILCFLFTAPCLCPLLALLSLLCSSLLVLPATTLLGRLLTHILSLLTRPPSTEGPGKWEETFECWVGRSPPTLLLPLSSQRR